jgi:CRP-like cAMP-binding protein
MHPDDEDVADLAPFDAAMIASGRAVRFSLAGGTVWPAGAPAPDALFLLAGTAALNAETPLGPFELCRLRAPCVLGLAEILLLGTTRLYGLDLRGRSAFVRVSAEEARPWVLLDTVGGASYRRLALISLAQAIRGTNAGLKRLFDESGPLKDRFASFRFEDLIAEATSTSPGPEAFLPKGAPSFLAGPAPAPLALPEAGATPQREKPAEWGEAGSVFQLAGVDPELFPRLGMTVRDYVPGAHLARAGEAGTEAFLVLSGRVRVSANIAGQGEEAFAFVGPGQVLGEMALIENAPRSADLIAHETPVRVATLRREVFRQLVVLAPRGSATLVGMLAVCLARRLREAIQRHVTLYIMGGGFAQKEPQTLPPLFFEDDDAS